VYHAVPILRLLRASPGGSYTLCLHGIVLKDKADHFSHCYCLNHISLENYILSMSSRLP